MRVLCNLYKWMLFNGRDLTHTELVVRYLKKIFKKIYFKFRPCFVLGAIIYYGVWYCNCCVVNNIMQLYFT